MSYFWVFFVLEYFVHIRKSFSSWPAHIAGEIVHQKYLLEIQFYSIFQKIFLLYIKIF